MIQIRHVRALHLRDFAPVIDRGFDRVRLGERASTYRAAKFKPNTKAIAAYRGQKIVGALYWQRWSGMAFICLCFVQPRYRQKGVYRQMVEALIEHARAKGLSHVMAAVDDLNQPSMNAHARLGFAESIHYLKLPVKA
jgi:L-amino acid N-acyltransferase YncA